MLKRTKILLFIVTIGMGGLVCLLCYSAAASARVVINEVCSNNFSVVYDNNGKSSDYIELYNPSNIPVSLTGYSLSDAPDDLKKCNLDSVVLGPKSYMTIYADGSSRDTVGYAAFEVGKEGETIYLSDAEGEIIDSVEIPELEYNTCYARVCDAGKEWERKQPTPGSSNDVAKAVLFVELEEPVFSHESGFYEGAFELEIAAGEGESIYYTLDGSEPDVTSQKYEVPLRITDASENENVISARGDLVPKGNYIPNFKVDKATVVRAISYCEKTGNISEIGTRTYFVNYEEKAEYAGFPIVSIITDPDNLFDKQTGIYGNGKALEEYINNGGMKDGELLSSYIDDSGKEVYLNTASNAFYSGKGWEREAVIEYFSNERDLEFNREVGIRISGQSTRKMAQKSFNIFARDIYDADTEAFFSFWNDNNNWTTFKLRNGGSDNEGSKIKDPFLQSLVKDRDVATQKSSPCIVFLNGEYWGIYNLRERYKEEYFTNYFGLGHNDIWMIDSGSSSIGDWDAWNHYRSVIDFAEQNDLSDDTNYAEICQMIDVQSLIDFYCINLYIDNIDVAFDKNMSLWRSAEISDEEYKDGKWRWMIYDVDLALEDYKRNTFEESEYWKDNFDLMDEVLMRELLKNEGFRKQFCLSFMDMVNETFIYESVHLKLLDWVDVYKEQVIKDHQRFYGAETGEAEYDAYIAEIDDFFRYRKDYIVEHMAEEFGLTGTKERVVLETNLPEGGEVIINTLQLNLEEKWEGEYYTDYPISVTAVPAEGYRFVGWTGDIRSEETEMTLVIPTGGLVLQAEFEKIKEKD